MTVIPSGFAEVAFVYGLTGDPEPMVTTLGFGSSSGTTFSDLDSALADIIVAWVADIHPAAGGSLFGGYTLLRARASVNGSDTGLVVLEVPINLVGTGVDGTVPQNTAFLVRKQAAIGGRENRGRMFVPPCLAGEGSIDSAGRLSSGLLTSLQGRFDDFMASMAAGVAEPMILHTSPTPITSLVVAERVATQRRRLRP